MLQKQITNKNNVNMHLVSPKGGVPWRILIISIVVFGLSILVWAGIDLGYSPYLNSKIESINNKVASLNNSLSKEERGKFITLYSQFYNINTLSLHHLYPSNLVKFIEDNTYQDIVLSGLDANIKSGIVIISGTAPNYSTLSKQISMYKTNKNVVSISLNSSNKEKDGSILFNLKVVFTKLFFK